MNTLNIIFLSCAVAVTVAQKVGDTSNDIIDGQRRNAGGYGLLRPGLQGGYGQGGYNQGGYNQGGYNQGGYNQGGYNQGGYNQGYNGYNGGYGGGSAGFGQGYGGYQGYGGNQGYGGGVSGFGGYPGAGHGGYQSGFGGTGGYGGSAGGYPSGFGQGYPGYGGGSSSGYRPNPYKPGFYYDRPGFPELGFPGRNQYKPFVDRTGSTPYNYHTGSYPVALEDGYRYSDNVSRYLGRKAGEIKESDEKS